MQCFKNAELVQSVSVIDRAFHYGDGCFTTGRIRDGLIELEELHLDRLKVACQKLFLNADFSLIQKSMAVLKLHSTEVNGTFKIIISRGDGQRGYSLPPTPAVVWFFYYPKKIENFQIEVIQTGVLTQQLGTVMPNLVGIKTLNRLEQVLLKTEADQHNYTEALVTDLNGYVIEGVSSNCFVKIDHKWITPELGSNGVHGIMRKEILHRMHLYRVSCEIRAIRLEEIKLIQSLFFCNALSPMKVVSQLSTEKLDTQACIDLFHHLQLNQIR